MTTSLSSVSPAWQQRPRSASWTLCPRASSCIQSTFKVNTIAQQKKWEPAQRRRHVQYPVVASLFCHTLATFENCKQNHSSRQHAYISRARIKLIDHSYRRHILWIGIYWKCFQQTYDRLMGKSCRRRCNFAKLHQHRHHEIAFPRGCWL